jgi:phosphate transport system protein
MRRRGAVAGVVDCPPPPAPGGLDLREIDESVMAMFAQVPTGLSAATRAFLGGDRESARLLIENDSSIDSLQTDIERLVQGALAHQPMPPGDLRFLVTVLRIVPELERSGDLVEHIALRTQTALTEPLSPRALDLIQMMSDRAVEMWRTAEGAYRRRDATTVDLLRASDEELDDLHVRLTDELSRAELEPSVAIELGLIARFLERLGDHAVNVAARIAYVREAEPTSA